VDCKHCVLHCAVDRSEKDCVDVALMRDTRTSSGGGGVVMEEIGTQTTLKRPTQSAAIGTDLCVNGTCEHTVYLDVNICVLD